MKNLEIVLISIMIITSVNQIFAQKKGEIQLGLGSGLLNFSTFNNGISGTLLNSTSTSGSGSNSATSFSFLLGFFPDDKIRADFGFGVNTYSEADAAIYANIGGRFFYRTDKKVKINGGISANLGLTEGTQRNGKKPINFSITPIEVQYWPFEGGALTSNLTYTRVNLNIKKREQNSYAINVGLLIRLK